MKREKWSVGMCCVAALTLLLAACGDTDGETDQEVGEEASEAEPEDAAEPEEGADPEAESEPEPEPDAQHDYEDGDVIRLVVATDAGGGFDTHARLLQPYFEEALRDETGAEVTVQVENMGGAEHRTGTEYVAGSEADGRTIGYTFDNALVSNQVIAGTDYDARNLSYIAGVGSLSAGLVVQADLGVETLEELVELSQERPVTIGAITETDVLLLNELLSEGGLESDFQSINYGSTAEIAGGMLRGEADAGWSGASGLLPFVEDNEGIDFLITFGCEPAIDGVPPITDEADAVPNTDRICARTSTRLILGPEGLSEGNREVLESALLTAGEDEEFIEQAEAAEIHATFIDGSTLREGIEQLFELYEDYQEILAN